MTAAETCWICGAIADTGEHKVKRSLLVALHGSAPYRDDRQVSHARQGEVVPLRGPNAKQVKYRNVLCANCNNSRTQPFDVAFDTFAKHALAYEEHIVRSRMIDFADVYGA